MYEEEAKIEKMNEKICQLTRVIYLLHSKNSDSQSTIESIISSYDEEINNIVQEANNALSILKDKIKHLESPERMTELTERMTSQCQLEIATKKNELESVFNLFQSAILKEYEATIEQMQNEVNDVREAFAVYKERIAISQQNEYNKAIDDIKQESHRQIESLIITYEDKNKQKEIGINNLTQKNNELVNQIEQLIKDSNVSSNKIMEIDQEYNLQLSALTQKMNQLIKKNTMRDNAIILIEKESMMKIKESNTQKEYYIQEREKLKKRCTELENEVKETKAQLHQMKLQFESIKINKEALDSKNSQFNNQIEVLELTIKEAQELFSNELKVNENLTKDNSSLHKQLETLENKIKQLDDANRSQIDNLMLKLKESEEKCKKKILTIKELKGNHQSEMNQLKFSFQTTIDEMKRVKTASDSSSQEVQRLRMVLNEEKVAMESKHKEEMDRITFKYSMTINELKNKHNEDMINIKQENVKMKDRLQNYEKEMKKKQEEFKLNQIEHFQKMKHDFMDALNIQQEKNYNLTNEINDLENYLSNRPSREEDIAEISKLREELNAKEQELQEMRYMLSQSKNDSEGKEGMNLNSMSLQGKNLKKIKIVNANFNVNGNKETPDSGNGYKKAASSLKNSKYTNANYGMIFSKK